MIIFIKIAFEVEVNEKWIENYLEEYEIKKNGQKLRKKYQQSLKSGISDFKI